MIMKKGKILKLRLGFNPNSSSIGLDISVFLWSAVIITTVVNAIVALVSILKSRSDNGES
jgi:hypothetical protein